jgi:hypothetical protein
MTTSAISNPSGLPASPRHPVGDRARGAEKQIAYKIVFSRASFVFLPRVERVAEGDREVAEGAVLPAI